MCFERRTLIGELAAVAVCTECVEDRVMTVLDWGPIRQIHRADDSWICFCRKGAELPDGTRSWLELGGIRADELETMFPQVVRSLFEDSFFSINFTIFSYSSRRKS